MLESGALRNDTIIENQDIKVENVSVTNINESENEIKNSIEIVNEMDSKELQNSDNDNNLGHPTFKRKRSVSNIDGDVVQGENTDLKKWSKLDDTEDKNVSEHGKSGFNDSFNIICNEVPLEVNESLRQDIVKDGT